MDLELDRLADLLTYLIEKYGDKIELRSEDLIWKLHMQQYWQMMIITIFLQ